jgi:hypothetical protein
VNPSGLSLSTSPCLEFVYTIAPAPVPPNPTPIQGSISARQCFLRNLPPAPPPLPSSPPEAVQLLQADIASGLTPRLFVPGLGSLYISGVAASGTDWELTFNPTPWSMVDPVMGAGDRKRFYTFALYLSPRPVLGEPAVLLPTNVCVDLQSSNVPLAGNVDIVFAPNGQVITPSDAGQIYLWVRDYTLNGGKPSAYPSAVFDQGGEQQIVALRAKSGSLGVYPVMWPPHAAGEDEYTFARDSR